MTLTGQNELKKIRAAAANINTRTGGCVTLEEVQGPQSGNYVKVTNNALSGCWSFLGMMGGEQQLNLGFGCVYRGVIEHEFLHALGVHHEHMRPDRYVC